MQTSHLSLCRAFLYDRCALLRSAFQLHGLLLQPGQGGEACGTVCWYARSQSPVCLLWSPIWLS